MFFGMFGQLSQQFVLPNMRVAAAFAWETYIAAHVCPVRGAVADGDPRLSQIRP